jgi:hypothetical protein
MKLLGNVRLFFDETPSLRGCGASEESRKKKCIAVGFSQRIKMIPPPKVTLVTLKGKFNWLNTYKT